MKTITIIIQAGHHGFIKIPNKMAMFLTILLIMMRIVCGPYLGRLAECIYIIKIIFYRKDHHHHHQSWPVR